jgi:hypothetical protein
MEIIMSIYEGKRDYEITLSRRDFDDICSGCPDGGFIVGRHKDVYFNIFNGPRFSETWKSMPMNEGYFLNVGVDSVIPAANATNEEWDKSAQKFYDNLETAINNSGRTAIEDEIKIMGRNIAINLGYVTLKVEAESEVI